jgi:hypothetical protein
VFDGGVPSLTDMPQVQSVGGPVASKPTFVSVTFPGDPLAQDVDELLASVGCTDYWRTITSDYGIGDAVAATPVRLTEAAPKAIDNANIQTWLGAKLESHDPAFAPPSLSTVYSIVYPAGTTVTMQGHQLCGGYDGYHDSFALTDGTPVIYTVAPRCGEPPLDNLTFVLSHELMEACTDPLAESNQPAFGYTDPNHAGWWFIGSEVGDMCGWMSTMPTWRDSAYQPPGYPWTVERIWSNSRAAAGLEPCVPAAPDPYCYAAPIYSDELPIMTPQMLVNVPCLYLPVDSTATIPVRLVGPGAGTMTVAVEDAARLLNGGDPALQLSLSATTGQDGDTLQLTIKKLATSQSPLGFALVTQTGDGRTSWTWGLTAD